MFKKLTPFLIFMLSMVACSKNPNYKGDLGGVPVDLPKNLVHLVEYNGEPSWKFHLPSKKNYQSKIRSFGFELRYTDNTILDESNKELEKTYWQEDALPNSPWVSVGISSGSDYHRDAVHRIGYGRITHEQQLHPVYMYEKLAESQFGLEVYASPGIDPKTNKPYRQDLDAEDVFIKRDDEGQIVTYIKCSNRKVTKPPCTQYFGLEPTMALYVRASYSRHNLADWQKIEHLVKQRILSFRKLDNQTS